MSQGKNHPYINYCNAKLMTTIEKNARSEDLLTLSHYSVVLVSKTNVR